MKLSKLLVSACMLLAGTTAFAQYTPTDSWPYMYEDFKKGTLQARNVALAGGEFNIPVNGEKLHYLQDGKIMEIPAMRVLYVTLGDDMYVAAPDKLMKVLASSENGYVLSYSEVDMEKMDKVDIGYGIQSSSSSAQKVRMSSLGDLGIDLSTQNYIEPGSDKKHGKPLALKSKTYIYVDNTLIEATKNDVIKESGIDKKVMKAFIKEHNIKFRDNASLMFLVDYIAIERNR